MKTWITAAALAIGLAGAANAATRTFQAVFSGSGDPDGVLLAIGADPSATEMVYTWSFDDAATPLFGPSTQVNVNGTRDSAGYQYLSFSVSIGGVTIAAPDTGGALELISISDWQPSSLPSDSVSVFSLTDQVLSNGTTVSQFLASFGMSSPTVLSDLSHPSASTLNGATSTFGSLSVITSEGSKSLQFRSVVVSEITPVVPLPAGLPLLAGGLLSLGLLRRRIAQR